MTVAASSPHITPGTEPSHSWETRDDPTLAGAAETLDQREYTSPLGWTHRVTVARENVDPAREEPYSITWETPDYTHHEYRTVTGDWAFGPHITRSQTELRAMTRDGALALARALRNEIISASGHAHDDIEGIVARADDRTADRTTLVAYFEEWDAAIDERDERDAVWRAERARIHGVAREEYATVCTHRRALLEDIEADSESPVSMPVITDEAAYDALVDAYVAGDIWMLEFENRLAALLE